MVYNGNSDTLLVLRSEIYWLWQVFDSCGTRLSAVLPEQAHLDGRRPPLPHGVSATWFWGRWVQSYSAVHSGAFQPPFSGWLQGKVTTGIHGALKPAVFWSSFTALAPGRERRSSAEGGFLWHCSFGEALPTGWQGELWHWARGLCFQFETQTKNILGNLLIPELQISPHTGGKRSNLEGYLG